MVEARQGLEPVAGVVAGGRLSIAPLQHGDNNGGEEEEEEEESHEQITPPTVLTLWSEKKNWILARYMATRWRWGRFNGC